MCSSLAKCLLVMINMLFLLIGSALIALGIILAFVPKIFLEAAYREAKAAAANGGFVISGSASDLKEIPLAYESGIALLVIGIFLFVISTLGWCGSCCTSCCKWMLVLFCILMALLMIAEIVVGTMFYVPNSPLHESVRKSLKEKITSDFNENSSDAFSTAINLINKNFECCGIDSGKDFGGKSHKSCAPANEDKGCYTKLSDLIQDNIIWAGLALGGILLFQLIEIVLALIIYKSDNKVGPI